MTTLAASIAAIEVARGRFRAAVHEVPAAAWTRRPAGSAEEAWSPLQIAEHVLASDWYFAGAIARAAGKVMPVRPAIEARTPADAIASCDASNAPLAALLAALSDVGLPQPMPTGFPPTCGITIAEALAIWAQHIDEHSAQLRAAATLR